MKHIVRSERVGVERKSWEGLHFVFVAPYCYWSRRVSGTPRLASQDLGPFRDASSIRIETMISDHSQNSDKGLVSYPRVISFEISL